MPYHLNLILALLLFSCALFTAYKIVRYMSLVLATPLQVLESGYDLNQVKQVYAFTRVTILLLTCSLIVYLSPFPQMITRIIGFHFLRLVLELLLSLRGNGIYAASMLIFYEGLLPEEESDDYGQAFRTVARGATIMREQALTEASLLNESTGVMMRIYAAHCKPAIRKQTTTGKASAAGWSLLLFALTWYLFGS